MGINGIELRHLRYFIAVAEERNFRKASERLNITQPPLSRAIQQVEEVVGCALLERTTRRVKLTDPGQRFLEGCYQTLSKFSETMDDTRAAAQGQVGRVRLGYTDFAISGRLPSLLTAFRQQHPRIVLKPFHGVTNDQLRRLSTNRLDVGFVTGPIKFNGLETLLVQRERFVCIVYEDHPFANRRTISINELAEEDFVLGPAHSWEQFHAQFYPICSRAGFLPNVVQEAFNSAAILSLVAGGIGVTVLSEGAARSAIPGLITIQFNDVPEYLDTFAIWRSDDESASTCTFRHFLSEVGRQGKMPFESS